MPKKKVFDIRTCNPPRLCGWKDAYNSELAKKLYEEGKWLPGKKVSK